MPLLHLFIQPTADRDGTTVELEALDVAAALAITDINLPRGRAELWDGPRRLARLVKRSAGQGTFWEIG